MERRFHYRYRLPFVIATVIRSIVSAFGINHVPAECNQDELVLREFAPGTDANLIVIRLHIHIHIGNPGGQSDDPFEDISQRFAAIFPTFPTCERHVHKRKSAIRCFNLNPNMQPVISPP